MSIALSFRNVSKRYRGAGEAHWRYKSLREDVRQVFVRVAGRALAPRPTVHALEDVSFEIAEGEAIGLIGRNGSGKTTSLKLMSRITYPSDGVIRVRGRVGALIEVGTGLHPELTGRENVRLFGRILGLTRRDVAGRFDEIVEFAELQHAIDQPVKQYSSGMQLRLGFSIAAHLEPDVLLVDEALAVGDAGFQYRCVERMAELVRSGLTLVLVSHDLGAIETLCTRALHLERGRLVDEGPAADVVRTYLNSIYDDRVGSTSHSQIAGDSLTVEGVTIHSADGESIDAARSGEPITIRLHVVARRPIEEPIFTIGLGAGRSGLLALATMLVDGRTPARVDGPTTVECTIQDLPLAAGVYEVFVGARGQAGYGDLIDWGCARLLRVVDDEVGAGKGSTVYSQLAPLRLRYRWTTEDDDGAR